MLAFHLDSLPPILYSSGGAGTRRWLGVEMGDGKLEFAVLCNTAKTSAPGPSLCHREPAPPAACFARCRVSGGGAACPAPPRPPPQPGLPAAQLCVCRPQRAGLGWVPACRPAAAGLSAERRRGGGRASADAWRRACMLVCACCLPPCHVDSPSQLCDSIAEPCARACACACAWCCSPTQRRHPCRRQPRASGGGRCPAQVGGWDCSRLAASLCAGGGGGPANEASARLFDGRGDM